MESDRLFREGKRLYEAGDYKGACAALASSDELDPAIGTLGLLAACHEKQGDLLAARKEYLETARRAEAKKDSRAEFAAQQAEALKARLARVEIRKATREPGLEIKRDGDPVLESELGAAVRVNPGAHTIVARATGLPEWTSKVTLKEGELRVLTIPELDPSMREGARWVPPTWLIATAFGVGGAGITAGTIAGAVAITKNDESLSKSICKPISRVCPARETALSAATASTIAFSVGGAGAAAGAVLFFVARARSGGDASKKAAGMGAPLVVSALPVVERAGGGVIVTGVF